MSTLRETVYMVHAIEEDVAAAKAELRTISQKMDRLIALLGNVGTEKKPPRD